MRTSTTRWLLLLALALGAFILFYERRHESSAEQAEQRLHVLPGFSIPEVTSLTLIRGTNLAVRLERINDRWAFRSPFTYPAQPAAVERLLTALAELRRHSQLSANEVLVQTNGLAGFGFSPPAAALVVQQGTRRFELRLGAPTLLGGQLYAQVVGQEGLVTVDASVLKCLPTSLNEWRDTALVSLGSLRFDRLDVRPLTNGFEVVRNPSNRVWEMTRPLPLRANNAKIEALLDRLDLARISQFVTDDPRADLEPYGLQPPDRELIFGQGTNDLFTLQVGRSPTNAPDQVFVRPLANSNVVLVPRAALEPWLGGFREFCDRRLMVFKPEVIDRIEVRADESFVLQRQTNATWRLVAPYSAPADSNLVWTMFGNLAELEFRRFEREVTTDFAGYGLAPPRRQYLLETTVTNPAGGVTNAVLAQLDIGAVAEEIYFFARRTPENAVVTFVDFGRLPRAGFQLRDRRIWDVDTNQIIGITIQQFGQTRKLLRTGPAQWTLALGAAGTVNSFSLEEAAYRLGHLRAEKWVARGEDQLSRYGFGAIDHQVTLEIAGTEKQPPYTVRFGRVALAGRSAYAAVFLDGQPAPVIFECPGYIYDFVQSDLSATPAPAGAP